MNGGDDFQQFFSAIAEQMGIMKSGRVGLPLFIRLK